MFSLGNELVRHLFYFSLWNMLIRHHLISNKLIINISTRN